MKEDIIKAYVFLREKNQSIPSEVLDLMKDAALQKCDDWEEQEMTGYKPHRHETNPKEKELHDKFRKELEERRWNPDSIVFPPANNSQTYATDTLSNREIRIMISTIQWLGSPVGQSFLRECGFEKGET